VVSAVRSSAFLWLTLAAFAPRAVAADPLWQTELRAGFGVAMSGSGSQMSARPTPLELSAIISFAFNAEPPLWGYGGLAVETFDRNAVGTVFGVTLVPGGGPLRLSGGSRVLIAPYTMLGATASLGACVHATRRFGLCAVPADEPGDGSADMTVPDTHLPPDAPFTESP
jgi:hypothetical protein